MHEFIHAEVATLLAAFEQWVYGGMVKDQGRRRSLKKAKQRVPPAKLCACERDNALHSAQPSTPTVLTSSTLRKRDQHITLVCPMQLSFGSGRSHAVRNPPHASVALSRATDVVRQGEAKNVTETKSFDYTAATAALQRSLSRPVYAFHGQEICLNASFSRRIAVVALPTLATLHCVAL